MTAEAVAAARRRFPSADAGIFLDHASISPVSTDVAEAMAQMARGQALQGFQPTWLDDLEAVRADAAWLVGSAPQDIAFVQNTSFGLSLVANGLDWQPGHNVVLSAGEFPSNFYPWVHLRRLGVEVRLVDAPAGHVDLADLMAAIDSRTQAVSISSVQFSTGYRYDLRPLGQECRARGVLLVVDGTQSVGALRFDVQEIGADVLAVSGHKWMLGPPGAGFAHVSEHARDRVTPPTVGWLTVPEPFAFDYDLRFPPGADRYEPGTENVIGTLGLGAAIRLMREFTPEWIESRVLGLTGLLADGLRARGYEVLSDRSDGHASGILIFRHPQRDAADVYARLVEAGVRCAPRGGGVRFSPHFYNSEDEVQAVLALL